MPFTTERRRMNEKERHLLIEWSKPIPLYRHGGFGCSLALVLLFGGLGGIIGAVVGFFGGQIIHLRSYDPITQVVPFCFSLGGIIGIGRGLYRLFFEKESLRDSRADLQSDVIEVTHYTASSVMRIEVLKPIDDNYFESYAFQIEPNLILLISARNLGQTLSSEKCFPCQSFEIARLPHDGPVTELICTGSMLPPIDTLYVDASQEVQIQGIRHIKGTLEQLETILSQKLPTSDQ